MMNERIQEIAKQQELYNLCSKFVADQNIHCAETVYQSNRVIENAYEFIEKVCNIVGYCKCEDEDDEE
jgi:hypothetical protein